MSARRKRRVTKKPLTPEQARTERQVCELKRTYVDSGEYWFLMDESSVTLSHQKIGDAPTGQATLPRHVFEKFVRWYQTGSMRKART